jgi:hypothetical protein
MSFFCNSEIFFSHSSNIQKETNFISIKYFKLYFRSTTGISGISNNLEYWIFFIWFLITKQTNWEFFCYFFEGKNYFSRNLRNVRFIGWKIKLKWVCEETCFFKEMVEKKSIPLKYYDFQMGCPPGNGLSITHFNNNLNNSTCIPVLVKFKVHRKR